MTTPKPPRGQIPKASPAEPTVLVLPGTHAKPIPSATVAFAWIQNVALTSNVSKVYGALHQSAPAAPVTSAVSCAQPFAVLAPPAKAQCESIGESFPASDAGISSALPLQSSSLLLQISVAPGRI